MGTEVTAAHEWLTKRQLQILDHLEQAQALDVPLTEYASASNDASVLVILRVSPLVTRMATSRSSKQYSQQVFTQKLLSPSSVAYPACLKADM
jgi:hypothetical protein